jgi:hypothetical protein
MKNMDFKDQIKHLGEKIMKQKENIKTEEATKNAFIMPFIQCLGYDVFDPIEVVPEYITDIGTKKGEKIDYAIFKDGEPTILIECKHWLQNLSVHDGQLLRYFHVSKARFGILTNGITYRFYTDLVETNKMDEKPFFEFDINDMKEEQIEELKKFHKSYFEIDKIVTTASDLKYTKEIKAMLTEEFKAPSKAFVKFFVGHVYSGHATERVMLQFTDLVQKSTQQFLSDTVTDRLKSALSKETEKKEAVADASVIVPTLEEKVAIPTPNEMEAFYIVKSLLRQKVDSSRISFRNSNSYFSVLLDDSNRKPLCRFYLNGAKMNMGTFDAEKKENKHEIASLDEIFAYTSALHEIMDIHEHKGIGTSMES